MDYMRRLQVERPVLFYVVLLVGVFVAFQVLIYVATLVLGPFGLPSWVPLVVVVGALALVARRQQR